METLECNNFEDCRAKRIKRQEHMTKHLLSPRDVVERKEYISAGIYYTDGFRLSKAN